ncbi:MAG TPA: adenylate/guanylate cyclase domain-containing protein [Spirochaetales bacterium]|nr:adenylate/guanylate cyclase domain-containing protein [Spirochaetales bacterium]HRY53961.1 adenylate/guanylate cyclase domain-containing protein [Spirochaetia bacterium]
MRLKPKRVFDEFFLYSSQFVVFFILLLFITPASEALRPTAIALVVCFLLVQISLLAGQGHKPVLRVLYSLITPAGYALVRTLMGGFAPWDMSNVFLWGASCYVGLFQALALAARRRWIKRSAETLLALGAVLILVFFYFYLDLRLGLTRGLAAGTVSRAEFQLALDATSFGPAFAAFLAAPQNLFLIFGVATLGLMLLASKVQVIGLRGRIEALFGTARIDEKAPTPERAPGEAVAVTAISADIRDFTNLADRVQPERAVAILNRYYALWAVAAERHGGRLAGLAGDSVIVVFGLLGEKDRAERALACAYDFIAELPGLQDDLASASLPGPAEVSIGIHSGTIVAGELGVAGSRRLGVFGEAVSVAARLDSLCREFKQDLLLSQPVFRELELESQARLVRIGDVLLRNSTQPVPVYGRK